MRIGALLLVSSIALLIVLLMIIPPISADELMLSQSSAERIPNERDISGGEIGVLLLYRIGRIAGDGLRPLLGLAAIGIIAGIVMLLMPNPSMQIVFDSSAREVQIIRYDWFFRPGSETHQLEDISEIRVERSTEQIGDKVYRASLVLSLSEGLPLTPNYVHYKKVFPFSQSYRYSYEGAHAFAEQVRKFLGKAV